MVFCGAWLTIKDYREKYDMIPQNLSLEVPY